MMQNQAHINLPLVQGDGDLGVDLSGDAKLRLNWNPELHQHFFDAVSQLGTLRTYAATSQGDADVRGVHSCRKSFEGNHSQTNEGAQIDKTLQRQLLVQQNLHEQIEVERLLELRIQAQGKYLQTLLKKAQEMIAGWNISPLGLEVAKEEHSKLATVQSSSSSSSELAEISELCMQKEGARLAGNCFLPYQPHVESASGSVHRSMEINSKKRDSKQEPFQL